MRMTRSIQSEQVKKEDVLLLPQLGLQCRVRLGVRKQFLDTLKHPFVQHPGVFRGILFFRAIAVCVDSPRDSTRLKHGQDIRTAPAPCMPTTVEDAVEVDWIQLPSGRDC
jgi:hypothetical protein